jgi:hypothetical protein
MLLAIVDIFVFISAIGSSFFIDFGRESLIVNLIWLAPLFALPAFALSFISLRALRLCMWAIALSTYGGGYALSFKGHSRASDIWVAPPAIASLFLPSVLTTLAAAVLAEVAWRTEKVEMQKELVS